jgi:hypothetical protein
LANAHGEFPVLTADLLYDYFEPLFRKEPYTSEVYKTYKLTSTVLRKVNENSLHSKIVRTIALIYLVEQFEKLPPTVDVIVDAFKDSVGDTKIITETLNELIEKDCIVYLKRSNNYLKIKDSSGVDIQTEITDYIKSHLINKEVTQILNNSAFDSYIYPTAYNDEHEITRYFDFTFIDSKDFFSVSDWNMRIENTTADGVIFAIIPKNQPEIAKIKNTIEKEVKPNERILFIVPHTFSEIKSIALEFEAVKNLKIESATLGDELLCDEYDIYIDDLSEVIQSFIGSYSNLKERNVFVVVT